MVSFIYIVCILSTQKHSSFQSDHKIAALFSWNAWPIWSVFHFPTLEGGLSPMTAQMSNEWWLACRLGFGAVMGSGGDCSKRGRSGAVGRDRASLCHCCHMECSPCLPNFQRDLKSLDFNMSQFKTQNGAGQKKLSCRATYGQMLQLVTLVCTISKSIESEWKIDFRLENKSRMSYLTEVGREGMVTLSTFERDFFFKIIDFKQKIWEDSRKFLYTQWPCY